MRRNNIMKICMLIVLVGIIIGTASATVLVKVEPSITHVDINDPFSVDITVEPIGDTVAGVNADIIFNQSAMQVTSISGGNILNIFNPGTYDNSAGTITNYWASCFSPGCGATTKGTFMTINFVAIAPGDTLVEIVPHPPKAIVSDPSGYALEYVLNPGEVIAPIPELNTGILTSIGIFGLLLLTRRNRKNLKKI